MLRYVVVLLALGFPLGAAHAVQLVQNGTFETGTLSPWVQMNPYYPVSPTTLFNGLLDPDYPMLEQYAGNRSCGWVRTDGDWYWPLPGTDSTQPSNHIRQSWTVAPGTYPVQVALAAFVHHNRQAMPEDLWGCGLRLRIFCDGNLAFPQWEYSIWAHMGDSFWRYRDNLDNQYSGREGMNYIQTSTGQVLFEIGWITKWAADRDLAAVDNVSLELVGAAFLGAGDDALWAAAEAELAAAKADLPVPEPPASRLPGVAVSAPEFSSAADRVFRAPFTYTTGLNPTYVAIGDFNKDGNADLAAVNEWNHTMSVLLGHGDGSFSAPAHYTTGHNPRCIAAADTNHDTHLDLIVANKADANIMVFLGNGNGTFNPTPILTETGNNPGRFCVGLFNNDNRVDLAVPEEVDDTFSILLGNGDGTFNRYRTYGSGDMTVQATCADFNKDSKLDLLITEWWQGNTVVYRGNGDGTFTRGQSMGTGWQSGSAAVGDFNKDTHLDFIAMLTWPEFETAKLWTGDSNLNFTEASEDSFGIGMGVATLDFDKDGNLDFVVADYGANALLVAMGAGQADFETFTTTALPIGDTARSVAVGDFNNDGTSDLVTSGGDSNNVAVLLGLPDGTLDAAYVTPLDGNPGDVALGDFDGDNDLDMVVTADNGGSGSDRIDIFRNNGDVFVTKMTEIFLASNYIPRAVETGDFNGDGKTDLVYGRGSASQVYVAKGNGNLTFQSGVSSNCGSRPVDIVVGHFNNDAHLDVATANQSSNSVSVLLGRGDGTFDSPKNAFTGISPESLVALDLNNDGNLDLATANSAVDTMSVFLGNGDGTMQTATTHNAGDNPVGIAAGHFNADAHADLAVANKLSRTVTLFFGNGAGGFSSQSTLAVGRGPTFMTADDFDGDGRDDLLVSNYDEGSLWLLAGNGDGTFAAPQVYWAARGPNRMAIGDMWNDGLPDVAVTKSGPSDWVIFANVVEPADADSDGIPDDLEAWPPAAGQTNRYLDDSDGDGLDDGTEDANRNGQRDAGETDARNLDSDGDQYGDGLEVLVFGTNPLSAASPGVVLTDADGDKLPATAPNGSPLDWFDSNPDSDGDRYKDGYETIMLGATAVLEASIKPGLGDVSKDGAVSNLDALVVQSFFLGAVSPEAPVWNGDGFIYSDPNRDGFTSNIDALVIQSFFLASLALLPL